LADHSPAIAHQFENLEQQHEAAELGMWLFLATEFMFFGGLFTAYSVYRGWYPDAFATGSLTMNRTLGIVNTAILLTSSFTMALAVHTAGSPRRNALLGWLLGTILLGIMFLGIKSYEYREKFNEAHIPFGGFRFEWPIETRQGAETFFNLYFLMTGLHAFHMVIGIGVLTVLSVLAWKAPIPERYAMTVHNTGLYWHFVDLVWVYLFPCFYLIAAGGTAPIEH
jgi:cytochrome c oxidase subunit 3